MYKLLLTLVLGIFFSLNGPILLAGTEDTYKADKYSPTRELPCCYCGGTCPKRNCRCCTCGVKAMATKYNPEIGRGTLQIRSLDGKLDSLNFIVPEKDRDKLKSLSSVVKDGNDHQFSLQFTEKLGRGLEAECLGIDENLPDRSDSVRLARGLMSILKNLPTHEADNSTEKLDRERTSASPKQVNP